MFFILAIGLFIASSISLAKEEGTPVEITINTGKVHGLQKSLEDSSFYYSFRGIPYAEPPVGLLRYANPEPVKPWVDVKGQDYVPSCSQTNRYFTIIGREDCLYLNIYTPHLNRTDLPVMVYIHGGGFERGNADNFGGRPLDSLLSKDIVLVAIQYRLGVLGFMSTGNSILPGNLGLRDQAMALQFIRDNVHHFGGDKMKVTLFGQSAGAISIHLQTMSPYTEDLFIRAILQSGSALNPLAIRDDHALTMRNITHATDCVCPPETYSPEEAEEFLTCLRSLPFDNLVIGMKRYASHQKSGLPFYMVPRVDGDFIPDDPAILLKQGKFHNVSIIFGNCQNEAAYLAEDLIDNYPMGRYNHMDELHKTTLPSLTGFDEEENTDYLVKRSFFHYLKNKGLVGNEDIEDFEKFLTDSFMVIPQDEASALHAASDAYIYRYKLQHRGNDSFVEDKFKKNFVGHSDDLMYLFDMPEYTVRKLESYVDIFLSNVIISLWTNFASTGKPTPNLDLGFRWDPMSSPSDFSYLSLRPDAVMKPDDKEKDREFWRDMPLKRNKILHKYRYYRQNNI